MFLASEDEMGGAWRAHETNAYKILIGKLKGRDQSEDLDVDRGY
jgi:hypothetical protein